MGEDRRRRAGQILSGVSSLLVGKRRLVLGRICSDVNFGRVPSPVLHDLSGGHGARGSRAEAAAVAFRTVRQCACSKFVILATVLLYMCTNGYPHKTAGDVRIFGFVLRNLLNTGPYRAAVEA